jgi:nucleotide-binding universal stress UspA family protein
MTGSEAFVIAYDGTDVGDDALALGSWLAAAGGNRALVVDVYPEDPVPLLPSIGSSWISEMRDSALAVLDRARSQLPDGLEAELRAVPATSVARALDRLVAEVDATAVVLGSSHRGVLRRIGIGKTADRLLHGATVPVLIAPRGMRTRITGRRPAAIGCAFVATPDGEEALRHAAGLAQRLGASLKIYSVVAHGVEIRDRDREREQALLDQARAPIDEAARKALASLPEDIDAEVILLEGGVVDALSALDCGDCQVLVCGSRGYGPVGSVLLGGVSARLVRRATVPVMVVPRASE